MNFDDETLKNMVPKINGYTRNMKNIDPKAVKEALIGVAGLSVPFLLAKPEQQTTK